MAVTADKPAPYAPGSTVLDVIKRYRDRGLPTPVTKDVLLRASVSETVIPRVLQTLQLLDLIKDDGQPTETFEGIRKAPEAEFKQRLAEWLNATYADALKFIDPASATEEEIRDAFRNYQPVGQQIRMVALFIALYVAAGVRTAAEKNGSAAPRAAARPVRGPTIRPRTAPTPRHITPARRTDGAIPEAIAGMLANLPVAEGWAKGERDKFINAFTAVLDYCIPVVVKKAAAEEPEDDAEDE